MSLKGRPSRVREDAPERLVSEPRVGASRAFRVRSADAAYRSGLSRVNDALFMLAMLALFSFGWMAVYDLWQKNTSHDVLTHVGGMVLGGMAVSLLVWGVRWVKRRVRSGERSLAGLAKFLVVGAVVPIMFLGAVMLATPPFTDYFYYSIVGLVLLRLFQWLFDGWRVRTERVL